MDAVEARSHWRAAVGSWLGISPDMFYILSTACIVCVLTNAEQ